MVPFNDFLIGCPPSAAADPNANPAIAINVNPRFFIFMVLNVHGKYSITMPIERIKHKTITDDI